MESASGKLKIGQYCALSNKKWPLNNRHIREYKDNFKGKEDSVLNTE